MARLQWDKTSLVLVEVLGGRSKQASAIAMRTSSTAKLIDQSLVPALIGHDALAIGGAWRKMVDQIRNLGQAWDRLDGDCRGG